MNLEEISGNRVDWTQMAQDGGFVDMLMTLWSP